MGFAKYRGKKRKLKKSSNSSIVQIGQLSKSTIADLPSREVKSIIIESNELKPVKSEVFKWKSNIPKVNNKKRSKSPLNKIKPTVGVNTKIVSGPLKPMVRVSPKLKTKQKSKNQSIINKI